MIRSRPGNQPNRTLPTPNVEEPAQLHRLQREQCDLGQGFLFARPLNAAGIDDMLDETRDKPVDARDDAAVKGHR
jgi:hypothetical protein